MTNNIVCKDCLAHSGIKARLDHVEADTDSQWTEINSMKKWLIGTLTASVLSLVGILATLIITIFRSIGKMP